MHGLPGRLLVTARGLVVITILSLGGISLRPLVHEPLRPVLGDLSQHGAATLLAMPFEQGLVVMSAALLLSCSTWLVLATAVLVVQTLWCVWRTAPDVAVPRARVSGSHPQRARRLPAMYPRALRRLVLGLCGVGVGTSLTVAPALADPPDVVAPTPQILASLNGLALPDRTLDEPARTLTVRRGDSLWAIAQRVLPAGSDPASITTAWHRLYQRNAFRIGTDPDLLVPGTTLNLPTFGSPHRKERP